MFRTYPERSKSSTTECHWRGEIGVMSVQRSYPMSTADINEVSFSQATLQGAMAKGTRNDALDITKGILVVIMVLYHWINYFVTLNWDVYRYLRFITPSFILITGFVLSNVYLRKYLATDLRLHRRLLGRGLKLLLLFT